MIELGASEIKQLDDFVAALADVRTPDDMFPPDQPEGGVREPRRPISPTLVGSLSLGLAEVYDMNKARQRRLQDAVGFLLATEDLVPA